jgi:hypothetical protein
MEQFDWNFLFELIAILTVGTVIFSDIFDSFTRLTKKLSNLISHLSKPWHYIKPKCSSFTAFKND